jgi:chromate transport protein ChrA
MKQHHVGIFVGLILGLALVLTSFGEMLVVALAGVIGWIVMRTVNGDIDVSDLLNRSQRRRS